MKAILVINGMPRTCYECSLHRWSIDGWTCTPVKRMIEDDKPEWCPLKPLPQKRESKEEWLNEYHRDEYADEWNACLNEITGETE